MKCINPTLVRHDETGNAIYRSFDICQKNQHKYYHFIKNPKLVLDCGKCLICRKKRAIELAHRCVLHASLYGHNCFITLTWDENHPEYHNNLDYTEIQKFKKRLQSHVWRKHKQRIKIFNVHEYGKNGKKHWHLLIFNYDFTDKILHKKDVYTSEELKKLWPYGLNSVGDVTTASAMYQAQYMEKDFKNGYVTSNKKSHSKHSGLARPYFERHYEQILQLGYVPIDGRKMPIPRYFQKLAKRHWAYYFDPDLFKDFPHRKAEFRPFKRTVPNRKIALLYVQFLRQKSLHILDLEKEYNDVILQYLTTDKLPDFILSGQNKIYDLNKKQQKEDF